MTSIPPSIRQVNTVIRLSLEVSDGMVSVHIQSTILPFSMRRNIPCCGGVLRCKEQDETRYALICGRYTGKWGFPKGKCEDGETALQCALREIEEEVGIWQLGKPVGRFTAPGKQTYFLFDVKTCLPLCPADTLEISTTGWMTMEEMSRLNTNAGVKTFLQWSKKRQEQEQEQAHEQEQAQEQEQEEKR